MQQDLVKSKAAEAAWGRGDTHINQLPRLELALVFLEEERVMQQSSVSISLSF